MNAPSRRCLVCGIDKPLTADNFQIVPSFEEGFSYYCNNCDPESRKQKTFTREEFNLFLLMKRKRRWQDKLLILSWLILFYSIFLGGMVWFPRRVFLHGLYPDAEWCRMMQYSWILMKSWKTSPTWNSSTTSYICVLRVECQTFTASGANPWFLTASK